MLPTRYIFVSNEGTQIKRHLPEPGFNAAFEENLDERRKRPSIVVKMAKHHEPIVVYFHLHTPICFQDEGLDNVWYNEKETKQKCSK